MRNLKMYIKNKEIVFLLDDNELEEIFDYIKGKYGCYSGETFEQVLEDAEGSDTPAEQPPAAPRPEADAKDKRGE